ncbi:MOSC domain-containing protein [Halomonas sp. HNIBRBA4712]|uniref:MOSC domain-containing protein n=1 Tax=Halomonas sp. HNIBRBA4712 TaxID=3373087 RepID=UPI0037458B7D
MNITRLTVYPVKSFKGIDLEQATLTAEGFAWDRRWMLANEQGEFVTQRQVPALALISVALTESALVLSHPEAGSIEIALEEPRGPLCEVVVWGDVCKAVEEPDDVNQWLVSALGEALAGVHLVRFASDFKRPARALDGSTAPVHFADGYPLTIGSTGSLAALNEALESRGQAPVPMERFRPNIVLDCPTPWAENDWALIATRDDTIRLAPCKPCQRCRIVTVDQQSADIPAPGEPLATLVKLNTQPTRKGAYFGQNVTISKGQGATLSLGDEFRVCETR